MYIKAIVCTLLYIAVVACSDFPPTPKFNLDRLGRNVNSITNRKREVQAQCLKITCANNGQSCAANGAAQITPQCVQEGFTFCNANQVCAANVANGQACQESNDCASDYCLNNVCAAQPVTSRLGASCSADSECNGYACKSGRCSYIALNEACSLGFCEPRLYCNPSANSCAERIVNGAACNFTQGDDQCEYILHCTPTSVDTTAGTVSASTCQLPYSLSSGALCADSSTCSPNLACNLTTTDYGTCVTAVVSSKASCDSNNGDGACGANQQCSCNSGLGQETCTSRIPPSPSNSASVSKAVYDCAKKNCKNYQDSCISKECKNEYTNYYKSQIENAKSLLADTYPTCFIDTVISSRGGEPTSGASNIVLSLSVVAILFFAILL